MDHAKVELLLLDFFFFFLGNSLYFTGPREKFKVNNKKKSRVQTASQNVFFFFACPD